MNDVWCLNVDASPFTWTKVTCKSESPPPRVYHSGAQCLSGSAAGMLVIFGGRGADQSALSDSWGLRRHRDGSWDWVRAPSRPGIVPLGRYQHSAVFVGTVMLVAGGRTNQVSEVVPFEAYNTETAEWVNLPSLRRFRHACWLGDDRMLYLHGGFIQDAPNLPTNSVIRCNIQRIVKTKDKETPKPAAGPEAKVPAGTKYSAPKQVVHVPDGSHPVDGPLHPMQEEEKVFCLSNQAHVAVSRGGEDGHSDMADMVRRISIDRLQDESRKMVGRPKVPVVGAAASPKDTLCSAFITRLMRVKENSTVLTDPVFAFKREYVVELAKEFQRVLQTQKNVVAVRTPVKIFGSLFGNFVDLMRLFDSWKAPSSDIESFAYVFLGNYVDRGLRGLETVCLLMALKVKYPDQIHLLRGCHEDRTVNAVYGFGDECSKRLKEDIKDPESVFQTVNNAFAWLPLAVTIEDKILCVHAGIGPHFSKLDDLLRLPRPVEPAVPGNEALLDAVWNDPAEVDSDPGFKKHPRRLVDGAMTYGEDKVRQFLEQNRLELIVRGHEVATQGFDSSAGGRVLTVVSCTDYCGKFNNPACMLVVQKTFEVTPKLVMPLESGNKLKVWIEDEEALKSRPPTPPRGVGKKSD